MCGSIVDRELKLEIAFDDFFGNLPRKVFLGKPTGGRKIHPGYKIGGKLAKGTKLHRVVVISFLLLFFLS